MAEESGIPMADNAPSGAMTDEDSTSGFIQPIEIQEEMESQPVHFMVDLLPKRLRAAAEDLGAFIGAQGDDIVFVPNATTGVNAVLRWYPLLAQKAVI